ncbi:MAG: hypothetical protein CL605_02150 [Altibacter sp.]|uniref:hypothetical protein n=1 Tax=Altibacter sp. TaxID=2024823 RepID=UPI000C8D08A4|nr:hypothetical protein [Altibacter sp.]MAP53684.1 hypothetical protein [Altibacter sp.]|tara:strand:+ start:14954 stop:15313 length:360 start_codon:yes stop_codon:yes gene_type:complete
MTGDNIMDELITEVANFNWTVKNIYNIEKTLESIIDKQNYSIEQMVSTVEDTLKEKVRSSFYLDTITALTEIIVEDLDSARIEMSIRPAILPEKIEKEERVLPSKGELLEQIKKDTKQI